jgi:hypothetical protein
LRDRPQGHRLVQRDPPPRPRHHPLLCIGRRVLDRNVGGGEEGALRAHRDAVCPGDQDI